MRRRSIRKWTTLGARSTSSVRLYGSKDRATIPNKDFMLTYRVTGSAINDAVLTHHSERGGFFTLILQPPQRVAAVFQAEVFPRSIVSAELAH